MKRQLQNSTNRPKSRWRWVPGVLAVVTVLLASAPAFCWEDIMTPNLEEGNWWRYRVRYQGMNLDREAIRSVRVDSCCFTELFVNYTTTTNYTTTPPTTTYTTIAMRPEGRPTYSLGAVRKAYEINGLSRVFDSTMVSMSASDVDPVELCFVTDSLIPLSFDTLWTCGQPSVPSIQVIHGTYLLTRELLFWYPDSQASMVLPRRDSCRVLPLLEVWGNLRVPSALSAVAATDSLWFRCDIATTGQESHAVAFKKGLGMVSSDEISFSDVMFCSWSHVTQVLEAARTRYGVQARPPGRRMIHLSPTSSSASTSLLFSINGRAMAVGCDWAHVQGFPQVLFSQGESDGKRFVPRFP